MQLLQEIHSQARAFIDEFHSQARGINMVIQQVGVQLPYIIIYHMKIQKLSE